MTRRYSMWSTTPKPKPDFRFNADVKIEEVTCQHCEYVPGPNVNDPKRCFSDHMRRKHRMHWKEFVIHEEP